MQDQYTYLLLSLQKNEGTNTEMLACYFYTSQAKAIQNTIST